MTEYYHIVPWYNSEEWCNVYEKIYTPTASLLQREEALNLLLVWKARCPSLPSGIESTLTLLEVHMQDKKNTDNLVNVQLLRLAYSSAIMRFVNHMLDTETAKGTSLYQAAKNLGVPDWIIDMRHDTAHSYNLPSIEILREAASISLEWLQKHYWDKHKACLNDYLAGQKEVNKNEENKIAGLMHFCVSLSVCAHPKCKIRNLSEIPNPSMRESIVNDARDLFGDQIDLSNLKTVSVVGLVNLMNALSKKLIKSNDAAAHVNKALLGEDSLFLSLELLNFMGTKEFYTKRKLSRNYVQCFEVLLTFLHTNDLLLDFILELIIISQNDSDINKCHLAALWVSEILKALGKSKQFINKIYRKNPDELQSKKRKELKLLFNHWFPSDKVVGLILDLQKPVPRNLMNINFVQPIISAYNPYLAHFIRDILNLVEPQLPKATADKICNLAKLISSPEGFPCTSSKIYTVDDLKMAQEPIRVDEGNDSDVEMTVEIDTRPDGPSSEEVRNTIWKLASKEQDWSKCPIGDLPWQQKRVRTDIKVITQ